MGMMSERKCIYLIPKHRPQVIDTETMVEHFMPGTAEILKNYGCAQVGMFSILLSSRYHETYLKRSSWLVVIRKHLLFNFILTKWCTKFSHFFALSLKGWLCPSWSLIRFLSVDFMHFFAVKNMLSNRFTDHFF